MNSLRMSHDANMRTDSLSDPLLVADGLTKRYAVTVLDHVTLDLRSGEIHALLGANGAGKSTLCRIIAGLVAPTSGQMRLNGEPYQPTGKKSAEKAGVQIVQQELSLIHARQNAKSLRHRQPNTPAPARATSTRPIEDPRHLPANDHGRTGRRPQTND